MIRLLSAAAAALSSAALSLPAEAQALINVDSGIGAKQCIEGGSVRLVRCDHAALPGQDGQLGRDADAATNGALDGALGFSFAKVCNSGEQAGEGACPPDPPLGEGANDWACTLDKLTGLVWELKTGSGLRSADKRYTYYTAAYNPKGLYRSATDASGFVDRVNAQGLCGASDWAIAHAPKFQAAMHYGLKGSGPRLDPAFFPNTPALPYWSSSLNPSRPDDGWTIHMRSGVVNNTSSRDETHPVRLVRGKGATGPGGSVRYTVSPDGSQVEQTAPGANAIWRRCVEGMAWNGEACAGTPRWFTLEEALAHAADVAASSGLAWHVPNVKELNWIIRREAFAPAVDPDEFPGTPSGLHCSATPDVRKPANAWLVDFETGRVGTARRGTACMLRLAR